jgi:hypothetical protein
VPVKGEGGKVKVFELEEGIDFIFKPLVANMLHAIPTLLPYF